MLAFEYFYKKIKGQSIAAQVEQNIAIIVAALNQQHRTILSQNCFRHPVALDVIIKFNLAILQYRLMTIIQALLCTFFSPKCIIRIKASFKVEVAGDAHQKKTICPTPQLSSKYSTKFCSSIGLMLHQGNILKKQCRSATGFTFSKTTSHHMAKCQLDCIS